MSQSTKKENIYLIMLSFLLLINKQFWPLRVVKNISVLTLMCQNRIYGNIYQMNKTATWIFS